MFLISRERLLKQLHKYGGTGAKPGTWDKGWDDAITRAILIVQQQPEVPIKRRAKVKKEIKPGYTTYICNCGICGGAINRPFDYKYCPYCGAKLEG